MKLLAILILLASTSGAWTQPSSAIEYGQVFLGVSSVKGKGLILDGKPSEQGFLKGMSLTRKKGTFICDNIDAEQSKSQVFFLSPDSKFSWTVSSSTWPITETFVLCGTVTVEQLYRHENIDTEFTFAAWGTVTVEQGFKQQILAMTTAYVGFCPQTATNCETDAVHPEPAMPLRMAHVAGRLLFHDCMSQAKLTGGTVQVVLGSTEEGRVFNDSAETRDVCDNIPSTFSNAQTSVRVDLAQIADRRRYTLDVPIIGREVPAVVYICAFADIHQGPDRKSCETSAVHVRRWRKVAITLEPNETNVEDLGFDYTHPQ